MEKQNQNRPQYWKSLEQYDNDPSFRELVDQEFMSSPLKEEEGKNGTWARREFLKLMGASMAMGSFACVRRPVEHIIPYVNRPEELTLGKANYYTSSFVEGGEGFGLLVKTREGRPIKIEGNPDHPLNRNGLTARAQAHVLSLYDPDRIREPKQNLHNEKRTNRDTIAAKWEDVDAVVSKQLKKGDAALLIGNTGSPATDALVSDFFKGIRGRRIRWEALNTEDVRRGQKASYGDSTVPRYRFDQAKMVVSVDADFLGTYLSPTAFSRQFGEARQVGEGMARFVMFESLYSLTGSNADTRFRIKPSQQIDVVMGLAHHIVVTNGQSSFSNNSQAKAALSNYSDVASQLGIDPKVFGEVANDLWKHRRESLVIAGGLPTKTGQGTALQIAVNFLNSVLENDGRTVDHSISPLSHHHGSDSEMAGLIRDMKEGRIKTLIIHGVNPAYALPANAGFVEAMKKVEMVLYTGDRLDETGKYADYVVSADHSLESWSDAELTRGVWTIQQPTIRPLYKTRAFQDSLMQWAKGVGGASRRIQNAETWYDYLRAYWKREIFPKSRVSSFEEFWQEALQKGVFMDPSVEKRWSSAGSSRSFRTSALSQVKGLKVSGYELAMYSTIQLGDGRLGNLSWLQELPDPVTKVVWDNYLCVSLKTAEKEGLSEGQIVKLAVNSQTIEVPVHIQPGIHDEVFGLAVGYGRTDAGAVGNGVGVNAFRLGHFDGADSRFSGVSVSITKTSKKMNLSNPQGHHMMEGRSLALQTTLDEYKKNPSAGIHKHKVWNIWSGHEYKGHKWAMGIDLNSCTGCSACVVACQSENNIPVVGKKYVAEGREMHWLRIDRYYAGTPENPDTVHQPMMCQHCDNAPCESVCPVLATVHSDEGLNEMVYNRCVGTRYCSNNCPYKVRRFNWFNLHKDNREPVNQVFNPDVGVRERGVMEKCTFCVQRIKDGKNTAKDEGRDLEDGDIKTACQQGCPTNAITFGDVNDPKSEVRKYYESKRAYEVLEEFHAGSAVRYLTKVRNADRPKPDKDKGSH